MKIVFLDAGTMGEISLAPIEKYGELVCYPSSDPAQALERVGDCDVLIVNKVRVTAGLIDASGSSVRPPPVSTILMSAMPPQRGYLFAMLPDTRRILWCRPLSCTSSPLPETPLILIRP